MLENSSIDTDAKEDNVNPPDGSDSCNVSQIFPQTKCSLAAHQVIDPSMSQAYCGFAERNPLHVIDLLSSEDENGRKESQSASASSTTIIINGNGGSMNRYESIAYDTNIPPEMEEVFLTMYHRKKQRELNGPQKKKNKYHLIALSILLILVYTGSSSQSNGVDEVKEVVLMLDFHEILGISAWIFLSIIITEILSGSKFTMLFNWCAIYWPLIFVASSVLFRGDNKMNWLTSFLIVMEIVTVLIFLSIHYLYPKFLSSKCFRKYYGPQRWWNIKVNRKNYRFIFESGPLNKIRECRYEGPLKNNKPHGKNGIWSDDTYHGEVLRGSWENGVPVLFTSREYGGKGNSFSAVKVAFFFASDDKYHKNKLIPSNDIPPRVGVASVECSVAGDFYQHLPCASLLIQPTIEGEEEGNMTIGACIKLLAEDDDYFAGSNSSSINEGITKIEIDSSDPRGVQIGGHVYNDSGSVFTTHANSITIDICSPLLHDDCEQIEEDSTNKNKNDLINKKETITNNKQYYLDVRDWTKTEQKCALIFFPGFNSWLQHSIEAFGQLLAMTNVSQHVYPIIYQWPGGQVPTYRHATWASASKQNRKNVLQLIRGLQKEGIRDIHFMSHSLGVQTLLAIFEESSIGDGNSTKPSEISKCFRAATVSSNESSSWYIDKLVCRSITMLNADFPVGAFVEKSFKTIRKICPLITLIGDRTDQALFYSQLINGFCNYAGYDVPSVLDSKLRGEQEGFCLQKVIGRDLDSLYIRKDDDFTNNESSDDGKQYLDLDIIDSTLLETNINGLRHSGFSVNAILLRDLEDIIVTGRRANDRPSLLHRNGNLFEYCYAPSHVSPK